MDLKSITRTLALLGTGIGLTACASKKDAQEVTTPPAADAAAPAEGEQGCGGEKGCGAEKDAAGGEAQPEATPSAVSAEAPTAEPEPTAVAAEPPPAEPAPTKTTSSTTTKKKPVAKKKKTEPKGEMACGEGTCG